MPDGDRIQLVYRVLGDAEEAGRLARLIAYEQTVELPEELVRSPRIREEIVGRVEAVDPDPDDPGARRVRLSYAAELSSHQLPQLLNLLYGNISILEGIRLVGLELPDPLLARFEGPRHGVEGLRRLAGVYDRPLLATALKPRGSSPEELAAIAGAFARGGGDIVKDDQNLVDLDGLGFRARVRRCRDAVEEANAATGGHCRYFPHVAAPLGEMEERVAWLAEEGLRGVLVAPLVLGLETARSLCSRHGLVMMAHPALSGVFTNDPRRGIAHGILLGTLFRLAGADLSIFPNWGGRFPYTREQCLALRDELLRPLGHLRPALPTPAGGMQLEDLPGLCDDYGADAVFLLGGSLLGHGPDLTESTRRFLEPLRERFGERRGPVVEEPLDSACELPHAQSEETPRRRLAFREGFRWEGRSDREYKPTRELPFEGVRRVELVGKGGERTAYELRYFELQPGGFTSLEKHGHTHTVIGARGRGVLVAGGERSELHPHDVAHVRPWEVHQLRNEGEGPFGFYCIVDHERDRPRQP